MCPRRLLRSSSSTQILVERQKDPNEQHAHDGNDDSEWHTHLYEIAEAVLSQTTTIVFTGVEIGVMKAADDASATIIANE